MNTNEYEVCDLLGRAVYREREVRRVWRPAGRYSTTAHAFRCELCNRVRPEEQRRELESAVCIHCVRAAGFDWE